MRQRNWFRGTCFAQNAGSGICRGMSCQRKGLKRYLDFFLAAAPSIIWINHKFAEMDVRALRRPVINQRLDLCFNELVLDSSGTEPDWRPR